MSAHATLYLLRKALAATPGDHESDTVRLTRGTVQRLVDDLVRLSGDTRTGGDTAGGEPVSADDFPEKGMTFIPFVQSVIPGISDADAEYVLWERTPFPLVKGRDDLLPYLVAERKRLAAREGAGS